MNRLLGAALLWLSVGSSLDSIIIDINNAIHGCRRRCRGGIRYQVGLNEAAGLLGPAGDSRPDNYEKGKRQGGDGGNGI